MLVFTTLTKNPGENPGQSITRRGGGGGENRHWTEDTNKRLKQDSLAR